MATPPYDVAGPAPVIRPLEERDWAQVHDLVVEVAATGETYAMEVPADEAATRAVWTGQLLVVAVDPVDDAVLGTARAGPNRPAQGAHVGTASFMVGAAARGRGVGRLLGEHVVAWHREHGFRGVQFNAVVDSNTAALSLWLSLGFVTIGRVPGGFCRPDGELVDLHVMYLDLTPLHHGDLVGDTRTRDRHRVLAAAARRFVDRGWTGTTIEDVAAEADVVVDLVHRFGSKAELLWRSVAHVVMTPLPDLHSWIEELAGREGRSVDDRLDEVVALLCRLQERIAPMVPVLTEAAALDARALSLRQGLDLRRLRTTRLLCRMIQRGTDVEPDAAELVNVMILSELYVGFRRTGWSTQRYGDWLRATLDRAVNGDLARVHP